jgi:hypothetical protein
MDAFDAAEILKSRWLDNWDTLPSQRIVLATCPFCGKGDRIRLLPDASEIEADPEGEYEAAWKMLAGTQRSPGICGFCLNVLVIAEGRAEMPGSG